MIALQCTMCHAPLSLPTTAGDEPCAVPCSQCGRTWWFRDGVFDALGQGVLLSDAAFSHRQWDHIYAADAPQQLDAHLDFYKRYVVDNVLAQSPTLQGRLTAGATGLKVLEIGSGRSEWAWWMAKLGHEAVAIDFCEPVLQRARAMFRQQGGLPGLFVLGSIEQMPFADHTFDLVYGGGVIEHLANTPGVLRELARVTRPGGLILNTVPAFSLRTMLQRYSIPHVPLLRACCTWLQMCALRGRWMRYGFQYSFTRSTLCRMHAACGLRVTHAGRYDVGMASRGKPGTPGYWLADREPFWDVLLVEAVKD